MRRLWRVPLLSFAASLAIGASVAAARVAPADAYGAARSRQPPLPSCFDTGSGYGTCEGLVIPAGGSVTELTVANDGKNRFRLQGPAPLQSNQARRLR